MATNSNKTNMNGQEIIARLRKESFNLETEEKLAHHPYIVAAEAGELTLKQKQAFCYEQYSIQLSDAISFAKLAGHAQFQPKSLTNATVPPADNDKDLFQFLLGGEIYASSLLLDHAKSLEIPNEHALKSSSSSRRSGLAQAYPSYWARLALSGNRAAGAAACAVNFPAWGSMCLRLVNATPTTITSDDDNSKRDLAFLQFFATPIENLDEMASAVIDSEDAIDYDDIVEHVRLLQEYEVFFWDAVFAAK